jgi:hypothetical protein
LSFFDIGLFQTRSHSTDIRDKRPNRWQPVLNGAIRTGFA